jgi:hypothetical protein
VPQSAASSRTMSRPFIEYGDDLISLSVLWETLKAEVLPRSAS